MAEIVGGGTDAFEEGLGVVEVERAERDGLDDARDGAEDGSRGAKRAKTRGGWTPALQSTEALIEDFVGATEVGAGDGDGAAGCVAGCN